MTNKEARLALECMYGKGCMFTKANIPQQIERLYPQIKGYRKFVSERTFKGSKLKRLNCTMTYHHLQHRANRRKSNIRKSEQ